MLGDDPVGRDQQLARRRVNLAQRQHQPFQLRHVQCRRRALARDIGNEHAETLIPERQKVVVVAADFTRRHAQRRHRHARHHQRSLRQQRHLDLVRDPELLLEPLLLRGLAQQVLDAGGHRVERLGQLAELVLRLHRNLVGEIALPDALGAGEQLVHRSGNRLGQRQTDDERDRLDDKEQPADDDQQGEQQRLSEAAVADESLRGGYPIVDFSDPELRRHQQRAGDSGLPVPIREQRDPVQGTCGRRGARRGRIAPRPSLERPGVRPIGKEDGADTLQIDAGLTPQALFRLVADQQIDDDGERRRRRIGERRRADQHVGVRVLARRCGRRRPVVVGAAAA